MIPSFAIGKLPRIEFGAGAIAKLPSLVAAFGKRILFVTGKESFLASRQAEALFAALQEAGFSWETVKVGGEPTARFIDETVAARRGEGFAVVVGIGGGSALDAAKAIAGLLKPGHSILDHLEGVGPERPYHGPATPFIAVPTTAGTGSEATKNAVIGEPGRFKKSFRDDRLVAAWAVVDPDLMASCPPERIAANGMDAFTQLLESFVSQRANPITDALARSGILAVQDALLPFFHNPQDAAAREKMAYAALLSGICLANAGLGAVHGLASPLGAYFPIPHGVVCGTLLYEVTRANIAALTARAPDSPALPKYAEIGRRFAMRKGLNGEDARAYLLEVLARWQEELALPRLSAYGVTIADIPKIVAGARGTSMKTNPIQLTDDELAEILHRRL